MVCKRCLKPDSEVIFRVGRRQCNSCLNELRNITRAKSGRSLDFERLRNKRRSVRLAAINIYSKGTNNCECCGETHVEFLALDHINGGGRKHRREIKSNIYDWLKRNNYPDGFRILCHNCNMSLGFYGYCPHGNLNSNTS